MLNFWNNENIVYLVTYLTVYNLSLMSIFYIIWTASSYKLKTISGLKFFNSDSFKKTTLMLLIFSIAGIPPLLGFFTKVNLISIIGYSSFILLMAMFPFLFAALYFYLQNIKYLLLPQHKNPSKDFSLFSLKKNYKSLYVVLITSMVSISGFFFLDDLVLIISWLFV